MYARNRARRQAIPYETWMALVIRQRATATLVGALALIGHVIATGSQPAQPENRLTLGDCTLASTTSRCGSLRVPEDHAAPLGRQLTLKIRVLARTGPDPAHEPLFVLAGGPGQAVTDHLEYFAGLFNQVRRNRDIVLVDQRGTSGAHRLDCPVADRSFVVPADLAQCLSRLSRNADLKAYGTESFIQDLELARDALKYDSISLYGASYGTRAAYAYARRYPERVRSLVLASPATLSMPVLDSLEQDGARALDAVVDDCLADRRCRVAFPRLREDVKTLRAGLADPFYALGLRFLLYSSATFRTLPYLLSEAAAGRRGALDRAIDEFRTQVTGQLSLGLHLSIMCGEDPSFRDASEASDASPVRRDYVRVCREWPRAVPTNGFYDNIKIDRPALVIVGEWDPVTSPRWARLAADQFSRSQLVVLPKTGHVFTNADACLGRMTHDFLDKGQADTSCVTRTERPSYVVASRN
jgi:pimeloyl-ACP methyl ester carboxylesterase